MESLLLHSLTEDPQLDELSRKLIDNSDKNVFVYSTLDDNILTCCPESAKAMTEAVKTAAMELIKAHKNNFILIGYGWFQAYAIKAISDIKKKLGRLMDINIYFVHERNSLLLDNSYGNELVNFYLKLESHVDALFCIKRKGNRSQLAIYINHCCNYNLICFDRDYLTRNHFIGNISCVNYNLFPKYIENYRKLRTNIPLPSKIDYSKQLMENELHLQILNDNEEIKRYCNRMVLEKIDNVCIWVNHLVSDLVLTKMNPREIEQIWLSEIEKLVHNGVRRFFINNINPTSIYAGQAILEFAKKYEVKLSIACDRSNPLPNSLTHIYYDKLPELFNAAECVFAMTQSVFPDYDFYWRKRTRAFIGFCNSPVFFFHSND